MMMAGERGVLGQTKNGVCDEIVKPRAGQWECSHMVRQESLVKEEEVSIGTETL
jgi:hypothetical protein